MFCLPRTSKQPRQCNLRHHRRTTSRTILENEKNNGISVIEVSRTGSNVPTIIIVKICLLKYSVYFFDHTSYIRDKIIENICLLNIV